MLIFQTVKLTGSEARLLAFTREYVRARGYPPTNREICVGCGWSAKCFGEWITRLKRSLQRKGMITLEPGRSRGLKLVLSRG